VATGWRAVADGAPATALLSGTTVLWASAAVRGLVDTDPAHLVGTDALDLVEPGDRDRARRGLRLARERPATSVGPFLVRLAARPGHRLEITVRACAGEHVVVAAWDVTARLEAERELGHRAGHDGLTGLPNRALLADRWIRARSRRGDDPRRGTFLLLCDVDGLKGVNDRHGHQAGDDLIVDVARRLASEVRPSDTVARLGGDEFVVLVEGVPTEHIEALALRLRRSVSATDRRRSARLSVGWSADDPTRTPEAVLAEADARMYEDKRASRSVDVRSPAPAPDRTAAGS